MKPPSLKKLQADVAAFNEKYKVGDSVVLRLDLGKEKQTKLCSEAYIASGVNAVAHFEGINGYYLIDRVK
jgi:hypothetical protein